MSTSNPRRRRGRQKIEMKKMTNEINLQVTFSKRRNGIFKKASELCTLCGVDVAIVVFSPAEKVFSFGHPNVNDIIDRYLTGAPRPQNYSGSLQQYIEAQRSANIRDLNAQLTQINTQLDTEKKCSEELNRLHKETQAQYWWASPIDDMNKAQLHQFKLALENLKNNVTNLAHHRLLIQTALANPTNQPPPDQLLIPSPQILQNPMMMQGHMFDGTNMMGFNNIGGYGPPAGGFF